MLAGCSGTRIPALADVLPPKECPDRKVHVAATPYLRLGGTSGSIQTPDGGKFGSTSLRRPTLSEMGVSYGWEGGVKLETFWKRHGVTAEWSRLHLDTGDGAILQQDLTSQANSFPAGTFVESGSYLTYVGFHYSYLHEIQLSPCDRLELRPGAGARWIDVFYRITGNNGIRSQRTYTAWAPNVLLDWSWRPRESRRLRFAGRLSSTLNWFFDEPRETTVLEATGRVHYDVSRHFSGFLETGYRHTFLNDSQPDLTNRVDVDFGPWIGIGIEARL